MKGILYKESEGYYLYVDGKAIATTRPLINFDYIQYKLDEQKCDEIFEGESTEVHIGMVNRLNIEKGLFEWGFRFNSDKCLVIEKI